MKAVFVDLATLLRYMYTKREKGRENMTTKPDRRIRKTKSAFAKALLTLLTEKNIQKKSPSPILLHALMSIVELSTNTIRKKKIC